MHHVVMYSAGGGSWKTATRVAEAHGTADLRLLFTDTLYESADTYRFLILSAAQIYGIALPEGTVPDLVDFPAFRDRPAYKAFLVALRERVSPLIPGLAWIADGRDVWDVFRDERFLGNSGVDPCSKILKRQLAAKWLDRNCEKENTRVYVGIDWTEKHRYDDGQGHGVRPRRAADGWAYFAPLTEPPYIWRPDIVKDMRVAGLPVPAAYELGFAHNNCLSGETRFLTREGIKTLRDTVGTEVMVLGARGTWTPATIRSFGTQPLLKLRMKRGRQVKDIHVTAGHRWFVNQGGMRVERLTSELRAGDTLSSMYGDVSQGMSPSAFGVAHGIVFGDGTKNDATKSGFTNPASVTLCGEKDQALLQWFPNCRTLPVTDVGLKVVDLPRSWKDLPSKTEHAGYLYGWLSGLLAADGHCSKRGESTIASAKRQTLEAVADIATMVGIAVRPIRKSMRLGLNGKVSAVFTLPLVSATLKEEFFKVPQHLANFLSAKTSTLTDWKVVDVMPAGKSEEVFCAVVPDGEAFTLEDNLLTGNCRYFCIKAGHEHYINLLRKDREHYLYLEEEEEGLRKFLNADVSVLTDRSGNGKKKVLTLRGFRIRFEARPQLGFDFLEEYAPIKEGEGGCGCMLESDDDDWTRALDERLAALVSEKGLGDNALKAIADELELTVDKIAARVRTLGLGPSDASASDDWGTGAPVGAPALVPAE